MDSTKRGTGDTRPKAQFQLNYRKWERPVVARNLMMDKKTTEEIRRILSRRPSSGCKMKTKRKSSSEYRTG